MEEKIYLKLKAGLTNSSLSERTIRAAAKRMALKVTEESQITDELITDGVELLKELNGQLSKDVAEIVKSQKEKPIDTPAPNPNPAPNPAPQDNTTEMLKRLEAMEAKFQESQKQNRILTLRAEAEAKLKAKQATNQYILSNAIAKATIEDGDTADTLAEKVIPIYDTEYKLAFGEGSVPRVSENTPPAPNKEKLEAFKKSKGIATEK